jgi:hypothetical protein
VVYGANQRAGQLGETGPPYLIHITIHSDTFGYLTNFHFVIKVPTNAGVPKALANGPQRTSSL